MEEANSLSKSHYLPVVLFRDGTSWNFTPSMFRKSFDIAMFPVLFIQPFLQAPGSQKTSWYYDS